MPYDAVKTDPGNIVLEPVRVRVSESFRCPSHAGNYGSIWGIMDGWFLIELDGDADFNLLRLQPDEFEVANVPGVGGRS